MLRTVVKRTSTTLAGATVIGVTGVAAYTNTDKGKGLKRQLKFWSYVGPIVAEYYIKTAKSSPWVKLQQQLKKLQVQNQQHEENEEESKQKRKQILNELHTKHAPEMLHILQSLKGLYVKLGQVLSVTALPIPDVYRQHFKTLQSDVPGWEDFDTVIRKTLEEEFNLQSIQDIFEYIEPVPCGAASIGQAHRAKLRTHSVSDIHTKRDQGDNQFINNNESDVVIKVQYPQASWQVPADIETIGQFLTLCIWAGIVDETSANLSYEEFARQFLSELDYLTETENLSLIYQSSKDINAPYQKRNVIVPKVYERLCTNKVITMEYIPGPKMEEEAKRQLEALGITTDRSIREIVKEAAKDAANFEENDDSHIAANLESGELVRRLTQKLDSKNQSHGELIHRVTKRSDLVNSSPSDENRMNKKQQFNWKSWTSKFLSNVVGVDAFFWIVRMTRRVVLLSQASTVTVIQSVPLFALPTSWSTWADQHRTAAAQAAKLSLTKEWVDALFDVHGHQIFHLGCFNADCHPGNILVVEDKETGMPTNKLGLIDFGQCKRLTSDEQVIIAKLILSVANKESDLSIANNFRAMGIETKADSTEFLAQFAKLMFGPFQPEHMDHSWHMKLHQMDKVLYFPKELSMVYRTSLLLRGLAISLQMNCSISEQWKHHAQAAVNRQYKM